MLTADGLWSAIQHWDSDTDAGATPFFTANQRRLTANQRHLTAIQRHFLQQPSTSASACRHNVGPSLDPSVP